MARRRLPRETALSCVRPAATGGGDLHERDAFMSSSYQRVLLKLSGEAMLGDAQFGIDPAVAQQMAERLSLALRSVADAQEPDTTAADYLLSGGDGRPQVQVIKTGAIVNGTTTAATPQQ